MDARLRQAMARAEEVAQRLADPSAAKDAAQFKTLGREHARLEPIVRTASQLARIRDELAQAREMAQEADPELVALARADLPRLESESDRLERELQDLLIPRDPLDDRDAIVEIRAGTGGDEAALFAGDLERMYRRFAERKGLRVEGISASASELGGYREAVFAVRGNDAFGLFRREAGVHRVQSVTTTDSAVRITHLPTGLVVSQQDQKSQLQNKLKAMEVLRARLLDKMIAEQEAARARDRRAMVGTGDRSAKIRTYNFPQNRVTDHRIELSLHSLDDVMNGHIDPLVDALRAASREEANALA